MEITINQHRQLQILQFIAMWQPVLMEDCYYITEKMVLTNCTIFNNTAQYYGAMYMGYGTTTITNTTMQTIPGPILTEHTLKMQLTDKKYHYC
jgi:hypothetical protein